ncbi:MAG: pantetheine-phosphate adenylyltransferase [Mycobacteriales bacterium]
MRRAACPGSFDPVTNGHLDIIRRCADIFDEVTVAVGVNKSKARMFDTAERVEMIRLATGDLPSVRVEQFDGLIVDFCRSRDIPVIVKGLRAVTDFDYELQMAQMNHSLAGIETLFMHTNPQYSFLSSSLVKEVAGAGGDVAHLVPPMVLDRLTARRDD